MTQAVEAAAAPDDVGTQVQWRAVRAPIPARRGDPAAAEAMAREAVEVLATSDSPVLRAEALHECAMCLRAGRRAEAAAAPPAKPKRSNAPMVTSSRWRGCRCVSEPTSSALRACAMAPGPRQHEGCEAQARKGQGCRLGHGAGSSIGQRDPQRLALVPKCAYQIDPEGA